MKKKYADYIGAGICPTCKKKPARKDVVLCDRCYELRQSPERKAKQRQLIRKYKENNRALGLCDRCKNPRVEGRSECQQCIDRTNAARLRKKMAIIKMYGSKCECCGETAIEFLTIDHIKGNGTIERKNGFKLYHLREKLLVEGKPNPDYRLLCMNCNFSMGIHGYCPHNRKV